jgi:hypothetical protein
MTRRLLISGFLVVCLTGAAESACVAEAITDNRSPAAKPDGRSDMAAPDRDSELQRDSTLQWLTLPIRPEYHVRTADRGI